MATKTRVARPAAAAAAAARRGRAARPVHRAGAGPVVLGPALTIAEVGQYARALAAMLSQGQARADAGSLESIDTAGLQLLLATAAAARERGLTLRLQRPPQLLIGAADALGVAGELAAVMEQPE